MLLTSVVATANAPSLVTSPWWAKVLAGLAVIVIGALINAAISKKWLDFGIHNDYIVYLSLVVTIFGGGAMQLWAAGVFDPTSSLAAPWWGRIVAGAVLVLLGLIVNVGLNKKWLKFGDHDFYANYLSWIAIVIGFFVAIWGLGVSF